MFTAAGKSAAAASAVYIEDVFSTYLYTGNGSTQTITNGIDLAGKGGLVWAKQRTNSGGLGNTNHWLFDSARGNGISLSSNSTAANNTSFSGAIPFGSSGFSVNSSDLNLNGSSFDYVSWTFRKQPKFFDVVTYTGNAATPRTITHSLGSVPGCIIVKKSSGTAEDWFVFHRSLGNTSTFAYFLNLNNTNAQDTGGYGMEKSTSWTSTTFSLVSGGGSSLNENGATYVAYLFAHNAGGFGLTGTDNVISCGSFTTDGSGNATVNLGYEPQWVTLKVINTTGNWITVDSMRGMPVGSTDQQLYPNLSNAETAGATLDPTATGFNATSLAASQTYIYIAIRRGPMKTPTSGTSVFQPVARTGTGAAATVTGVGFPTDVIFSKLRSGTVNYGGPQYGVYLDRMRGQNARLFPTLTSAENSTYTDLITSLNMDGVTFGADATAGNVNESGINYINHFFKRAPGFMDVVCYTGTGSNATQTHNLGVVPELMIVKGRSGATDWQVYSSALANTEYLVLNTTAAKATGATRWNSTTPTSSVFSLGTAAEVNTSSATYVVYLFATVAGVSKVGNYTGNGSSQTINCGFAAGARFVLIKRTDSTGDWYFWDSARGIVPANDPHLSLNTTAAEVTTDDSVDTDNSGFIVNQVSATNVNVISATYIFLAIA